MYVWEHAYVRIYMCRSKDNIQPWESGFLLPDLRRKVAFFQHLGPGVRTGLSFVVGSVFYLKCCLKDFQCDLLHKVFLAHKLGVSAFAFKCPQNLPLLHSPLHVTDIPFQIADDLLASLTLTGSCKGAQCLEVTRQWAFVGLFRILTQNYRRNIPGFSDSQVLH